jgi:hypothetical protein
MTEIIQHSNLATNSPPFALTGGLYQVWFSGTVADGSDLPALHQLVAGGYRDLDPPIRFSQHDAGGVKQAKVAPGAQVRWTIPGSRHLISTNITRIA